MNILEGDRLEIWDGDDSAWVRCVVLEPPRPIEALGGALFLMALALPPRVGPDNLPLLYAFNPLPGFYRRSK